MLGVVSLKLVINWPLTFCFLFVCVCQEQDESTCLGIKLASKSETAICFSDVYAVEFIDWGLVHESVLGNTRGCLLGYASEVLPNLINLWLAVVIPLWSYVWMPFTGIWIPINCCRCTALQCTGSRGLRISLRFGPHPCTHLVTRIWIHVGCVLIRSMLLSTWWLDDQKVFWYAPWVVMYFSLQFVGFILFLCPGARWKQK